MTYTEEFAQIGRRAAKSRVPTEEQSKRDGGHEGKEEALQDDADRALDVDEDLRCILGALRQDLAEGREQGRREERQLCGEERPEEQEAVNEADDVQEQIQSLFLLDRHRGHDRDGLDAHGGPDQPRGMGIGHARMIGEELRPDQDEEQ